jgi:hypothetical protein
MTVDRIAGNEESVTERLSATCRCTDFRRIALEISIDSVKGRNGVISNLHCSKPLYALW